MTQRKPIFSIDFDGVLHLYTSGWKGATVIPDPPVPGAIEFLERAVQHFDVQVYSSRSHWAGGIPAMKHWLERHARAYYGSSPAWLDLIVWPTEKPAAFVTLDDRAITFTGTWPNIATLRSFQPWWKKA